MREIEFRAWDKFKKVFIPNDVWALVQTDFKAFGIMLKDWEDYRVGEYFYENAQELTQYTGLKDKYGTKIFEGDIIGREGFFNRVIVYHKNGFYTYSINNPERFSPLSLDEYDFVFGNIHENPELLK